MTPFLGPSSSETAAKITERQNQILGAIEEFTKALAAVHNEISDVFDEALHSEQKAREARTHRTKAEMREGENKRVQEFAKAFKAALQKAKYAQLLQQVYRCVSYWLDKMSPAFVQKKPPSENIADLRQIPYKLAAIMFLVGDYYKACNLVKTCLILEPGSPLPRCILLRWSVLLGEVSIVDSRLDYEAKLNKKYNEFGTHKEKIKRLSSLCRLYGEFYRNKDVEKPIEELMKWKEECEKANELTFGAVELEAVLYHVMSHLGKVSQVTESTPDSLWCLYQRYSKSDSLLRNRVRGIYHDNQRVDFVELMNDPQACLENLSTFAECSDALRDYLVENFNLGLTREAHLYAEMGVKVAMKMGSFTKAIQMINLSVIALSDVCIDSATLSLDVARGRLHTLTTNNRLDGSPARCSSPARTVIQKLQESFDELKITPAPTPQKRLHDVKKDCCCELCISYANNAEFAMDYHCSIILYHGFAELMVRQMNVQYTPLRDNLNVEQCLLLGNAKKGLRMKPPVWFCEVYSLMAIKWLRTQEVQGRDYLRDTNIDAFRKVVMEQLLKFKVYEPFRQLPYFLACRQMQRHDLIGDTGSYGVPWMRPSAHDTSKSEPELSASLLRPGNTEAAVTEALKEYSHYSHVLYRDWRFPLCTFVGRFCSDPWTSAFMWSESTVISTRANARLVSGKLETLVFTRASAFESIVKRLPRDFNLIQLAVDEDGSLFLVKLYCERAPIILPLAHGSKLKRVHRSMQKVIEANDASTKISKEVTTPTEFWNQRRAVDAQLKTIVQNMQGYIFRSFAPFLLPSQSLAPRAKELAAHLVNLVHVRGCTFNLNLAEELVALCPQITKQDVWNQMIISLGTQCQLPNEKIKLLQKEYSSLQRKLSGRGMINKEPISYTFLAICPILSICPLEVMDIFTAKPHVGRIISVHSLFRQVMKNPIHPREVDVGNSFYVLDPDNNLVATQKRLSDFLSKFDLKGIVGGAPSTAELKNILEERDILFYLGHGSGSKHLSKKAIKESKCRSVTVLMGCGSVALDYDGLGLDGKCVVYDYTIANCPAVIGCLWMVTDGEIDRYFMALVEYCFKAGCNTTINDGEKRLRSLLEAMRKARGQSKLPYLTGAAVVNYGLSVTACEG